VATNTFSWLPVAIITLREFGISAYRTYWGRRGLAVPARRSAKVKTVIQELAIGLAILPLTAAHTLLGVTVLWVAVVITIVTGVQYVLDGRAAATSMLAD
jgi:CDP-diacylglycerol--glycerol-3-phosphate 3-phosphatidyltransferase